LTFKHKMKDIVERGANQFANSLRNKYGNYIVGPAEPVIGRIRNLYLMDMLLKLPRDTRLIGQCKQDILHQIGVLRNERSFKSVVIVPDVDVL
jgi:primosomal protein N' (replication factor Y) (superfamily II helicase)